MFGALGRRCLSHRRYMVVNFGFNMSSHAHTSSHHINSCGTCSKKVVKHKNYPTCQICDRKYHPKCIGLTPQDVGVLISTNTLQTWICLYCSSRIFPFFNECEICKNISKIQCQTQSTRNTCKPREFCNTCNKQGNILNLCDFCGLKSHPRCSAGDLGCKSCLREIYPGYDVNFRELYNYNNNALFNPYTADLDINFIGSSGDEPDFEHLAWSNCSELLNNCKYYELNEVQESRNCELKVLSLNVRSLGDKIQYLRDNIEQYSKFDLLAFNETNVDPSCLPFNGSELILENFHKPYLQSPARASNKGGGLAIYVNKQLTNVKNLLPYLVPWSTVQLLDSLRLLLQVLNINSTSM